LKENPAPASGKSLNPARTDETDAIEPTGGPHLGDVSDRDEALGGCQALTDAMCEGAVMVAPTGTIAYCNSAFAQLAQRSREALTGADFRELLTPAERPRFEALLTEAHGATARGEFSLLGPDGGEIALQLSVRFSGDAADPNACMVVTAVREPERGEERMRQLNTVLAQRIANLVEASADAILSIDLESRITDVNERTCVLTGFARQELIGRHFNGLFTDSERAAECMRTALAERTVKNFELSFRTRDGQELPVALGALAFGNSEDELQGVFVAARDISERQRVERERSLLATIVESSSDAIYSVTRDTIVTSWNRGAEQLYGYAAQEIMGQSVTICVPLARRAELVEQINQAMGGERIGPFDTSYRPRMGT
jgi:PAS domain S-box-containing protein